MEGEAQLGATITFLTTTTPPFALSFPAQAGITPDFPAWRVYDPFFNFAQTAGEEPYLQVFCGENTSTFTDCSGLSLASKNATNAIAKNISLAGYLGASLHWYAYAEYTAPAVPELSLPAATDTTPVIDFYIDPAATATPYTYPSISTGETSSTLANPLNSCASTATSGTPFADAVIGDIGQVICQTASYLFIPNSAEQSSIGASFSALKNTIATKPPVGYFALAIADMGSFSVATSSTSSILDATSTSEIYSIYEPLDAGVASVVGFMLLLWLFNRGRHIEI